MNWIPERLVTDGIGTMCRWIDIGDARYIEPFFDTTLARRRREQPAVRTSTVRELLEDAPAVDVVPPGVFIFHVSRCGSTLFSQLFGLDAGTVVLSEVPVLDDVLQLEETAADELFPAVLRWLGRRRCGDERQLVIKTDCWHLFHADQLRRLFPETPFVLLYRSPAAVLGSHRKARGSHMVPGLLARAPFTVPYDPETTALDQYAATVLELHCQTMLTFARGDSRCLLVDYDEGLPAAFLRTADWLGLSFDDNHLDRIRARCGYHAKRPAEPFGAEAMPILPGVDLTGLEAVYRDLKDLR